MAWGSDPKKGIIATVLESDPDHVDLLYRIGLKVFCGDATRLDLLHAAGAAEAKSLILAIKDEEKSLAIIEACRKHFPKLQIVVRAYGRDHACKLIQAGADAFVLEHQGSSLNLGIEALSRLGYRRLSQRQICRHRERCQRFHQHNRNHRRPTRRNH
jgi:voltage-gated potassium channel Kch